MSSNQGKRQQNINELNHILHHPSKSDVKHGQNEQTKQNSKKLNPKSHIKRYVALALVKLMVRGKENIKCTTNKHVNVTAKECDTNTLALIRSLNSLKFITILKSSKTNISIKLTSLGKEYIQDYIPKYKSIYHYLNHGKKSMQKSAKKAKQSFNVDNHGASSPGRLLINLVMFWFAINIIFISYQRLMPVLQHNIYHMLKNNYNSKPSILPTFTLPEVLITILIIIVCIGFGILIYCNRGKIKSIISKKNDVVRKNIKNATRENFIKFLKVNGVEEPDYRFGHDKNLPKIDTYLFNNNQK